MGMLEKECNKIMNDPIVKIVGQDDEKDFVVLELCNDSPIQQSIPRSDFELIAIDNNDGTYTLDYSRFSEEEQLEIERLTKELNLRLDWLIPHMPSILAAIKTKSLYAMGVLGSITRKYLEAFPDDSHADFIEAVNHVRYNILGMKK